MPTSYATTGSGTDWGTAANWTPTGPPAVGSLVTVNHPMTIASGTFVDIGASVSAQTCLTINAALTVADGGSLTLRGNVVQRNSGSFAGNGAGRIVFNSTLASPTSTIWSWTLGDSSSIPSTCSITITGTSTNRFRVSSAVGGGDGLFNTFSSTGGGTLSATYCDFVRVGDATNRLWYPNVSHGAWGTVLHNCVFWKCGALNYDAQDSTQPLDINSCVFTQGVDTTQGADIIAYITNAPNGGVTWQITGCDFGDFLDLIASPSVTVSGNIYRTAPKINGTMTAASSPPYVPTNLTLSGPTSGSVGQASTAFTVALSPTGTVPAGTVTVTPQVSGISGTFSPTTVSLTSGSPSATFTFTPTAQGTAQITLTNNGTIPGGNGSLLTPDPYAYTTTGTAATSYTLTGPSSGTVGIASSNFTVSPNGTYSGTITPHSSGSGTFSPTSLTWSGTSTAQTFTYTASSSTGSPHSISTTSSPQLGTDPAAVSYVVNTSVSSYATNGVGTDWGTAANWTPTGPPAVGTTVTLNHPMTIASGTFVDIGASVSAQTCLTINAALTIADGGSLTLRGNVVQRNSGSFAGNGAGRIVFNSTFASPTSTTWSWTLGDAASIPSTCSITITGTSTNRFRVSSAAGGGDGLFATFSSTGGGTLSATYCDFIRIGDATNRLWYPNETTGSWGTVFHNCNFWKCGALNYDAQSSAQPLDINSCVFTEGVDTTQGADIIAYITNAPNGGVTWQIVNSDFGRFLDLLASPNITVSGNIYRVAPKINGVMGSASTPPYVPTYLTLSGPSGGAPNQASTAFTTALAPSGTTPAGTVTVTPQVSGISGTFSPTTVSLTSGSPSATFTFTPTAQGTAQITLTNNGVMPEGNGSLLFPDPYAYTTTGTAATSYTLTGPSSGTVGVASSNFTVSPNGTYSGTITPHSSGSGTFSPASLTWSGTSTAQTFTYTASSSTGSPHSISTTSSPQLGTDPAAVSYAVNISVSSYTTNGAGTDWGTATNWTPTGPPAVGSTVTLNHPMTIGGTTAVDIGASVVGQTCLTINAALTVADGGSLTLRGNVVQRNSGSFIGNGAGRIVFNSTLASPTSTTWSWTLGDATSIPSTCSITITGTSTKRFRVSSTVGGGDGLFATFAASGGGTLSATYCDFVRVGDATNRLWYPNETTGSWGTVFHNCNFWKCGALNYDAQSSAQPLDINSCVFTEGVDTTQGADIIAYITNAPNGGVTWQIVNSEFGRFLDLLASPNVTVSGNTYRVAPKINGVMGSASTPPYVPTNLTLSGPSGGAPNQASTAFTTALAPSGTTPAGTVTVTPQVSGISGTFSPTTVSLTSGSPSATFTFTPTAQGTAQITLTNNGVMPEGNGSLLTPDPYPYIANATATFYTLAGPANSTISGWPSGNFTAAIPNGTSLPGTVTITPNDGGAGGTFTPTTVQLSTATPSATFTYTSTVSGVKTIGATNNGSLTNYNNVTYTALRSFAQAKPVWDQAILGHYLDQTGGGDRYATWVPPEVMHSQDTDNIYDPLRVYYDVRDYLSPSPPTWVNTAITAARYQNRDLYVLSNGGIAQPYYTFAHGLRRDWEQSGEPTSLVALILAFYGNGFSTGSGGYDKGGAWLASREVAYGGLLGINSERVGHAHKTMTDINVWWSAGYIDNWTSDPNNTTDPCIAIQPFMTGITMRVLIAYWERYRHNPNTTVITTPFNIGKSQADIVAAIPVQLKKMLDYHRAHSVSGAHSQTWFPDMLQYPYWDRNTDPINANPSCQQGYDGSNQPIPNPVLNPFLSHAFGWYAWYSGDRKYLQYYEESFIGCNAAGSVNGIASIESQKTYNEGYGTGDFLGLRYRDRVLNPSSWPAATAYTLTISDSASGRANQLSGRFTVKLAGGTVTLANPVVITPSDGGAGGAFCPANVTLFTDEPLACFRYAPPAAASGTNVTISVTNDGGLTNPSPVTYGVTTVATVATGITVTPPAVVNGPNEFSPDYVVALDPPGSVPPRACDADGGIAYIWLYGAADKRPIWSVGLTGEHPSATFQILPGGTSPVTIQVIPLYSVSGWTAPTVPAYTSAPSNSGFGYTLNGPSSGSIGTPVPIRVSALVYTTGTFTVTFTDGGGGVFNPPTVALNNLYRSGTVMYTPHSGGVRTIGVSNSGPSGTSLVDPAALTFLVGNPFVIDSGTAVEQPFLAVQVGATDRGTAVEGLVNVPSARIVGLDSGTGGELAFNLASFWIADAIAFATEVTTTSVTLVGDDTFSWSEFGPAIAATFSQVETGSATDLPTPPVVTAVSNEYAAIDAGAGLDYPLGVGFAITAILAPVADSAAAFDLVGILGNSFGAVDTTFAFSEFSNLTVTLFGTDLGVGAESVKSSSALRATDLTAQVSEVLGATTAAVTISDLFSWSESAPSLVGVFPAVDSGSLKDVSRTPVAGIDVVVTSSVDSGVMAEPLGLYSSTLRSFDPGIGSDGASTLRLNLGVVDSGTSADVTGSFTPSKVATDSGAWTDSGGDGSGYIGTSITTKIGPPAANTRRHKFFPGMFRR